MTQFLASVRSAEEAGIALAGGADIVDLKDPASGALGALPPEQVRGIVGALGGRTVLSATIGDMPVAGRTVPAAVRAMAATGVGIVKVGVFGPLCGSARLAALVGALGGKQRLVLVFFAEDYEAAPDFDRIAEAGVAGVMLDTRIKGNGGLLDKLPMTRVEQFVSLARAANRLCGLAGALAERDVPALCALQPDYLGFRGALCRRLRRTDELDGERVARIKSLLVDYPRMAKAV